MNKKIVVAITGASGVVYGIRLVEELSKSRDVYVVVSNAAKKVFQYEYPEGLRKIKNIKIYSENDIDAPIASSSFCVDAMVICPCSMNTLAAISIGLSDNLIRRVADIMIKEGKKLILVLREMPFSQIHLENMLKLSKLGVVIMPACPGFYHKPKKIEDMINFVIGKILDNLAIKNNLYKRWK